MKKLLLFHREDLTKLYIQISKKIGNQVDIIHVAYSLKEVKLLESANLPVHYCYSDITDEFFNKETLNYPLLCEIDSLIIENSNNRFNLNSSIQSDRGFSILDYNNALISTQVHYKSWTKIFSEHKIDYMLHEPCSLFLNHIAALICKSNGGMYIWQCQVESDNDDYNYIIINNDDYSCIEIESRYKYYLSNKEKIDIERCNDFINNYRKKFDIFLGKIYNHTNVNVFKIFAKSLVQSQLNFINKRKLDPIKNNINYWLASRNIWKEKLINIYEYKKYDIKFIDIPKDENYYYYSLNLEPEAVVLYLADGIYSNQIKLIENIAASLPIGYFLYVKDHPHEYAYRHAEDYRRLSKIPNIRLLKHTIPGKKIIANACGVFTINGTAGFEALMLGKQVFCFGKSYYYYSSFVTYIENIRNIREFVYSNNNNNNNNNNNLEFLAYVNAYLESTHRGFVNFFLNMDKLHCKTQEENATEIARTLIDYFENYPNSTLINK